MTTKDDIFLKLQEILAETFEMKPESITLGSKLNEDLELDSIDAVDLLVKMKQYVPGIIDPEQFKKVVTVGDVVDVLYLLLQKNKSDAT